MKAVFLDRDGVINRYPGDKKYVTSLRRFRFLPRVKKAIARLHKSGFKVFVVSNQAGINKGIFSRRTLEAITKKMLRQIEEAGGKIDGVYYCIHRSEENCPCRKPKSGLLDFAKTRYSLDMKHSYFIGDTIRDVKTSRAAGCRSILIFSGKEKQANRLSWEEQPDLTFKDLYEAVNFILREKNR